MDTSTQKESQVNTSTPPQAGRREWIGLTVLALACVLYAMDLTVLHLAVPSISEELKPTSAQMLWIVDIYGFLVAGSLITMGTLGDRIGRRRLLLTGATAFGLASLLAAFSTSAGMLIASRALMGIAGATLAPSTLSLIFNMFHDPGQRSVAIGIWITSFSVGGAIGPLLGGLLLEYFWWGSVFLLALPVMALLLVLGPRLLPEFRDPQAGRLDLPSAAMSLTAILAVIFGLKESVQDGLGPQPAAVILVGLVIGLLFMRRQASLADPLIELRLFRIPAFSVSLATNMLAVFISVGYFLFVAQYLQLVIGLSPLHAGLWSLPSSLGFIVGSNLAPRFVHRVRPAIVLSAALSLAALALGMLTQVAGSTGLPLVVLASVVISLALSPVFTLTTELIVGSAPPEKAGAASGISETGAELGGALGIAILGSIGTAVYRSVVTSALPDGIPTEAANAALDTLGGAVVIAKQLPGPLGLTLLDVARQAFVQGLHLAAAISAIVAVAAAILAMVVLRRVPATSQVEGQKEPGASAVDGIKLPERNPKLLPESNTTTIHDAPRIIGYGQIGEDTLVARFAARVNTFISLSTASPAIQTRLLEEVKAIARHIDVSAEAGTRSGYDRRLLYEVPDHWSLALISLRPGQQTHPHDHGGWGCAATVQGLERDRRFVRDASGNLVLSSERDYPPGTGYIFAPADIHQPFGADPRRVTVALHFMVHGEGRFKEIERNQTFEFEGLPYSLKYIRHKET